MASFGGYNPFPRTFGGDKRAIQVVHQSLLEEYKANGWDTSDHELAWCEAYAESVLIACLWAAARRSHNEAIALRMLGNLPLWELALGIHPSSTESDNDRRVAVATKRRSLSNNAEPDLNDVCLALMGSNFVGIFWVQPSEEQNYLPGINPGPPPLTWTSNKGKMLVQVTKAGLSQLGFELKVAKLTSTLNDLLPVDMSFDISTEDTTGSVTGFILDLSLLDETGL